ncbi:MAG: hypothetical protein ACRED1_11330 [Limisphaerales bacterium]
MKERIIMTEKTTNTVSDLFDQGLKNYEQALRAGARLQEETGKNWIRMFNVAASPQDFQKHVGSFDNDLISAGRKSMDECLELLERNTHAGVDLLRKGLKAPQNGTYTEKHAKVADICEGALKALTANAQAIVDINHRAMDSWLAFARKSTAPASEAKAQKA